MKYLFSILFLFGFIVSCTQNNSNQISISGKVLDNNVEEVKLTLSQTDIAINDLEYFAKVKEDSSFSFVINSEISLFGNIQAGNFYHKIFLTPGDELFIKIEGDTILYSGQGSEKNNFLYEIIEKQGLNGYYQIFEKNKNLIETAELAQSKQAEFKETVEKNAKKYKLSPEFMNFLILNNKSEYEGFMMYYKMIYSYRNKDEVDSLGIPEDYEKLKLVKNFIDDSKLSTKEYFYNIGNYIYEKMGEILKTYPGKKDSALQIVMFDSLYGKSKVYAIADWLEGEFNFNNFDTLIYNRFKKEIDDPLAREIVQKSYDKYLAKQKLLGKPLNEEFIHTELEDDKGSSLTFGDMIQRYKGKVIYLDFWSLGCGPCRENMPKSNEFKEKLRNYPIEFVYLTTDKKFDNLWEEVYKVSLTKENHYRLVQGFDARLLKFMKINWVPNYMLVDKDGKLISFHAVRPTDPKFEEEIMKYVN